MKTSEKIKRGLLESVCDANYALTSKDKDELIRVLSDAVINISEGYAYIEQLERELEWAKRAAKGRCIFCKWHFRSTLPDAPCKSCINGRSWEWRGVEEGAE